MIFEIIEHLLPATPTQHRHHSHKEEEGGGAERVILVPWEFPDGSARAAASKFLGAGRQRIIGQPSVGVVGSGWSKGKRMSVRVTRKVGHPCRLWEFGRDLPCSGNIGEEGWKSLLGRVRRVEEGMRC